MFDTGLILFSGSGCKACDALKAKLLSEGKDFQIYDVWEDDQALEFIMSKGLRTIPQLFLDGEKVNA